MSRWAHICTHALLSSLSQLTLEMLIPDLTQFLWKLTKGGSEVSVRNLFNLTYINIPFLLWLYIWVAQANLSLLLIYVIITINISSIRYVLYNVSPFVQITKLVDLQALYIFVLMELHRFHLDISQNKCKLSSSGKILEIVESRSDLEAYYLLCFCIQFIFENWLLTVGLDLLLDVWWRNLLILWQATRVL